MNSSKAGDLLKPGVLDVVGLCRVYPVGTEEFRPENKETIIKTNAYEKEKGIH